MIFDTVFRSTNHCFDHQHDLKPDRIAMPHSHRSENSTSDLAIPKNLREVTTEWLNSILAPYLDEHIVMGSQAKPFSDPGQTADIVDISLHYDSDETDLPNRMIAKLAALDPETRELCETFKHYERESAFYRAFSGDDLPLPRCFYTRHDPDTQDMVILMEHLAPSQSLSYAITAAHVQTAVRQAAVLHARWWNDDFVKRQPALVQLDDPDHWINAADAAVAAIGSVRRLVGNGCEKSIAAIEVFAANFDAAMRHARSRPFTLQHGDYHGKQMFFPNDEGEGRFAIIDWQFSVAGPAVWDVSRILNLGLNSDIRRNVEADLINDYLEILANNGVGNYGLKQFSIDHKFGTLFTQMINFIAVNQTDEKLLEQECGECGLDWKEVWLLRGERMIEELDVAGFIRSL